MASEKIEKGWRLSESHWFCGECGIVSEKDVQTETTEAQTETETGICRCGAEIARTTF